MNSLPYSLNISRAPIFEDFKDVLLTSTILSSINIIIVAQLICEPRKFNHKNFCLKQNLLNLENFDSQNFPAIATV